MARKQSRNKSKYKQREEVTKAATPQRMRKNVISTKGLYGIQKLVERLAPIELKWPLSMETFELMKQDVDIFAALNLNYILVEKQFTDYKITHNPASEASKTSAEFLKYCLDNMDNQTLLQAVKNIETFKEKGFSTIEKGYKRIPEGAYKDMWGISELANIPQLSLSRYNPFTYVNGSRKIKNLMQDTRAFENSPYTPYNKGAIEQPIPYYTQPEIAIPRNKFMLFGDNATDSTPFGNPLFKALYKVWKEKCLIEDYETVGVSKDLGGIVKLKLPQSILDKAAIDPASQEAQFVKDYMQDAANMHAGEQSYIMLPSDTLPNSNSTPAYDMTLQGVEGSGKSFKTDDLIAARRKAIFDCFGAGHIPMGDSGGSYNAVEGKMIIHSQYVKRDANTIADVLNKDLIPQLMQINGIKLSYSDLPKIVPNEVEETSLDELGKFYQRLMTSNSIVLTKENILAIQETLGFDTRHLEDKTEEELLDYMNALGAATSRSGDGDGTSGTGNTQNAAGGDMNMENN